MRCVDRTLVVAVDLDMKPTPTAILHNMRLYSICINVDKCTLYFVRHRHDMTTLLIFFSRRIQTRSHRIPILARFHASIASIKSFLGFGTKANRFRSSTWDDVPILAKENEMRLLDSQPLRDDDLQFRGGGTCRRSFVPCRFSSRRMASWNMSFDTTYPPIGRRLYASTSLLSFRPPP